MHIEAIDLIWIRMPLVGWFATSRGGIHERNILLVRVTSEGAVGWGESGADWDARYSYETVATCWHIIEDFLAPEIFNTDLPEDDAGFMLGEQLSHWPWHPMARAAIEEAVVDLEARRKGVSLANLYAGERLRQERIPVGISLGIQEDFEVLAAQIEEALDQGYRRIKLKIEPGRDVGLVRKVRERFGTIPLMVDANCAYDREQFDVIEALDEMELEMIEQPLEHDEIEGHALLQARVKTPLCLDESAKDLETTERALDSGAARIINIKCSRLGGRRIGVAVHDSCQARGIPVWCGGMLESGIGRLHNIALASLPNFTMPGDLSASRRYWKQDIIEPAVEVDSDGMVAVPDGPGLGHEVCEGRIEEHLIRRKTLRP